jgi:hypothetical protein
MLPFEIPESIGELKGVYPSAEVIMAAAGKSGKTELHAIACLWLSEGIPFAFREKPGLYEVVRDWIAIRLSIHPKQLTLIGSSRHGFSLAPPPKRGRRFDEKSDLDWSAVSPELFDHCRGEFESWATDYSNGVVEPRHQIERLYWDDNSTSCPKTIGRGFIDPYKIPTWDRYPLSQLIADTMWRVGKKCQATDEAPRFKKSTIRVYRDWSAFIRQLTINLEFACKAFKQ